MIFFAVLAQVSHAVQQTGFKRVKRGYASLRIGPEDLPLNKEPTDPYFPFQWYLVSGFIPILKLAIRSQDSHEHSRYIPFMNK